MKTLSNYLLVFVFSIQIIHSQDSELLFDSLRSDTNAEINLLPERIFFSQKVLWGKKGLFRLTGISKLSAEGRQKEIKLRRFMLKSHQVIGYATFAGMIAQGVIGGRLYNGEYGLYKTHKNLGNVVTASYFTGAALSLFAPPPLVNKKVKGLNSIKAHKILASLHFPAMVTTKVLSDKDADAHKIAAYTAVISYATAIIVFKF